MERIISTGFPALDRAIGLGGIPGTGLVELYGPDERSLKNLAFRILDSARARGEAVAFIDMVCTDQTEERGSDSIRVVTATDLAHVVRESESLVQEGAGLLAMGPLPDTDGENSLAHAVSRLREIATEYRAALLLIHPWRITLQAKLPERILDPNPIVRVADVRIEITPRNGDDDTGIRDIEACVLKNRHADPFGEARFQLL